MAVSTDTRTLQPGDTFVAIVGETHDGHAFAAQAAARGAARLVVERDVEAPPGVEVVRVPSTLDWLTERAAEAVRAAGPEVVAITGSVGKTSTRAAVTAVLDEAFPVVASEGNLNTPLGLSLTILNAAERAGGTLPDDAVLVLEMGARMPGDLALLCDLFRPTVSVVTNVKGVHVETLGSVDGVAHEKASLVRALGPDGTAVLNGDDPRTRAMAASHPGRTLLYGAAPDYDVTPDMLPDVLPILGAHAATTALAATAAGVALGMKRSAIHRGLASLRPEKGRLARLPGRDGLTLLDDSYNASPDAVVAALDVLAGLDVPGRRLAFLGDMLELGSMEADEHARVLAHALATADAVHVVGPRFAAAAGALGDAPRVEQHTSSATLAADLAAGRVYAPAPGDAALVKGSQGLRMERVAAALLHPDVNPADVLARQTEAWRAIA